MHVDINEEEVAWKFQTRLSSFLPLPRKSFASKSIIWGKAEKFLTKKGINFHLCQLPCLMKEYYLMLIFSLIQRLGSITEKHTHPLSCFINTFIKL